MAIGAFCDCGACAQCLDEQGVREPAEELECPACGCEVCEHPFERGSGCPRCEAPLLSAPCDGEPVRDEP